MIHVPWLISHDSSVAMIHVPWLISHDSCAIHCRSRIAGYARLKPVFYSKPGRAPPTLPPRERILVHHLVATSSCTTSWPHPRAPPHDHILVHHLMATSSRLPPALSETQRRRRYVKRLSKSHLFLRASSTRRLGLEYLGIQVPQVKVAGRDSYGTLRHSRRDIGLVAHKS